MYEKVREELGDKLKENDTILTIKVDSVGVKIEVIELKNKFNQLGIAEVKNHVVNNKYLLNVVTRVNAHLNDSRIRLKSKDDDMALIADYVAFIITLIEKLKMKQKIHHVVFLGEITKKFKKHIPEAIIRKALA